MEIKIKPLIIELLKILPLDYFKNWHFRDIFDNEHQTAKSRLK